MKRLNFYIDNLLLEKFERVVEKKGFTKSQVLRSWIDELDRNTANYSHQGESSYNLYIENELNKKLVVTSKSLGLSKSELVRKVIDKNVQKHENTKIYETIPNMNLRAFYQNSVDFITEELGVLGACIAILNKDRLYSRALAAKWYTRSILQLMARPIESFYISTTDHKSNLLTKVVINKRYYINHDFYEISQSAFSEFLSKTVAALIGYKSGIVLPIIYKTHTIGTLFLLKNCIDEFEKEIPILLKYCDYLAEEIVHRTEISLLAQTKEFAESKIT